MKKTQLSKEKQKWKRVIVYKKQKTFTTTRDE